MILSDQEMAVSATTLTSRDIPHFPWGSDSLRVWSFLDNLCFGQKRKIYKERREEWCLTIKSFPASVSAMV